MGAAARPRKRRRRTDLASRRNRGFRNLSVMTRRARERRRMSGMMMMMRTRMMMMISPAVTMRKRKLGKHWKTTKLPLKLQRRKRKRAKLEVGQARHLLMATHRPGTSRNSQSKTMRARMRPKLRLRRRRKTIRKDVPLVCDIDRNRQSRKGRPKTEVLFEYKGEYRVKR